MGNGGIAMKKKVKKRIKKFNAGDFIIVPNKTIYKILEAGWPGDQRRYYLCRRSTDMDGFTKASRWVLSHVELIQKNARLATKEEIFLYCL